MNRDFPDQVGSLRARRQTSDIGRWEKMLYEGENSCER